MTHFLGADYAGKVKTLDVDEEALFGRLVAEMGGAHSALEHLARESQVDLRHAFSLLYVQESNLAQVQKLLGVEMDSSKSRENRYAMLRQANERIRELESSLGSKVGAEATVSGVKALSKKINSWWHSSGPGYVQSVSFDQNGGITCSVFLSSLVSMRRFDSSRPVSSQENISQWLRRLCKTGFRLAVFDGDSEQSLLDTDGNRRLLVDLFLTTFPSARIMTITAGYGYIEGIQRGYLTGMDIYIADASDIEKIV